MRVLRGGSRRSRKGLLKNEGRAHASRWPGSRSAPPWRAASPGRRSPPTASLYTACKLKATGTIRLIDPSGPSSSLLSRCTSLRDADHLEPERDRKATPGRPEQQRRRRRRRQGRAGRPEGRERTGRGQGRRPGQRERPVPTAPRANGASRAPRASRASLARRARPARKGLPGRRGGGTAVPREPGRTRRAAPSNGVQGVTKVAYATALDSDAVSITC